MTKKLSDCAVNITNEKLLEYLTYLIEQRLNNEEYQKELRRLKRGRRLKYKQFEDI